MLKKLQNILTLTLMLQAVVILAGCSSYSTDGSDELVKLKSYRSLSRSTVEEEKVNEIRHMSLRNTAMSLGARGGLSFRANKINAMLNKNGAQLDRVFNFAPLVLEHNILPPVLIEGRNTLTKDNGSTLRLADRSYTIIQQARFITTVPNWRDYLLMNYLEPETPDRSLLPKNGAEAEIWDRYIQEGWSAGIAQAQTIYQENLAKLKRDIQGMIRYKTLLNQNMVSAPYVATTELGITGNSSAMTVNDRVLRITALPELQASNWHTEITEQIKIDDKE